MNIDLFTFVIVPLLIFIARVIDVSLGTIRVIFIGRGNKFVAPLLGFFEILIWLVAIKQILANLTNVFCYFAYAGGFATGTYVGMVIDEKLALGKEMVRIITRHNAAKLIKALKKMEYKVTVIGAQGPEEKVHIIYTIVDRQHLHEVVATIQKYNAHAFYAIEDIRYASDTSFPRKRSQILLDLLKKGK